MKIIAYTYNADVHCPDCTRRSYESGGLTDDGSVELDSNGLPMFMDDSEGNYAHPVFDIDESDFTHCGDCGEEL